jgi:TLC domain
MCRNTDPTSTPSTPSHGGGSVKGKNKSSSAAASPPRHNQLRLLYSLDSFRDDSDGRGQGPSLVSCLLSGLLVILFLTGMELVFRHVFEQLQHQHPLLQNETNRLILARHVGVDTLALVICSLLGFCGRHLTHDIAKATIYKRSDSMDASRHTHRLFTYHPVAFRCSLFFLAYQIKNTYDTIAWGDGPEFVFHHVFSMLTAYGAMVSCCGHMYTVFFFGLSEISTAVLCLLANFDDEHGVIGLGEAFPVTKVVLGAVFALLFITCRCILWPVFAYYFTRDVKLALKGDDVRAQKSRGWLKFFLVSLTGITFLQVLWLGQIVYMGHQELKKAGFLNA